MRNAEHVVCDPCMLTLPGRKRGEAWGNALHFLWQLIEPQYELLQPQPAAECIPISLQFILKALSTEHSFSQLEPEVFVCDFCSLLRIENMENIFYFAVCRVSFIVQLLVGNSFSSFLQVAIWVIPLCPVAQC